MNAASFSEAFTPPPAIESSVPLGRVLLELVLAVAAFDICFWKVESFGLSEAVFFAVLAGIILFSRDKARWSFTTRALLVLLGGALVAALFETGFSNTMVFLCLTLALAGDLHFATADSRWGRGLSQFVAMIRAPGRMCWLAARLIEATLTRRGGTGVFLLAPLLILPALFLALVFGSLLSSGNAVFGFWTNSFFDWFWRVLALYLDPLRLFLWFIIALAVLPLLQRRRSRPGGGPGRNACPACRESSPYESPFSPAPRFS